jgi:hypothetical protein
VIAAGTTTQERAAFGKAARAKVPRASHGEFTPAANRPDPLGLLNEQAASRIPELVPIRYGRMASSPFSFYRGAALVIAADLATTPSSGFTVQACGDAHMSNFGLFGTPERHLVFDVNDFDETLPGPWEWDVKRLTGSLAVAARGREFTDKERTTILRATAETYRVAMRQFAGMRNLDVWYTRFDIEETLATFDGQLDPTFRQRTQRLVDKAHTHDSLQAVEKLTEVVDGRRRIVHDPPLIVPVEQLPSESEMVAVTASLPAIIQSYRRTLQPDLRHLLEQYELVHLARKVVGVGSVGTRAWILLLLGRDDGDPLFLQAKEAQASVLERFVKKSEFSNHGARVVAGQRVMQAASDIFLGWHRGAGLSPPGPDYYVRQLRDWKGSAVIDTMTPTGMASYGQACAWTLARAHARSGDRIAIASYLGSGTVFDNAIAAFSEAYADQNQRDFDLLSGAIASGTVTALTGV